LRSRHQVGHTGPTQRRLCGRAILIGILAVGVSACRQDMHDAPRYDPLESSAIAPGQPSARPLLEGTVARGHLNDNALLHTGMQDDAPSPVFPFEITRADLDRGQERYNIYCAPCHSRIGDGLGMVVQRGYRQATSFHLDRMREAPVGYFFDVMTNGFGAMGDYRSQIAVEDRWRIAAYIRALQLSHQATTADVPAAELERLQRGGGNE